MLQPYILCRYLLETRFIKESRIHRFYLSRVGGTNNSRGGQDKEYGAARRGVMSVVVIFVHNLK